ncbi:hypothetical protein DID88_003407 [Monilinia fructigena]|uniref:Uncharacterized protein n=1 Tax=Monilinia fructigena TaxID=38457 RepID=A0A395IUE4_9HELO|nr:hypothetical protein DID88_003407 [Monilinia fructigena]
MGMNPTKLWQSKYKKLQSLSPALPKSSIQKALHDLGNTFIIYLFGFVAKKNFPGSPVPSTLFWNAEKTFFVCSPHSFMTFVQYTMSLVHFNFSSSFVKPLSAFKHHIMLLGKAWVNS